MKITETADTETEFPTPEPKKKPIAEIKNNPVKQGGKIEDKDNGFIVLEHWS